MKAGDVLVELDKKDLEVALAKAQADLADAEATLDSARSDVPAASVSSASTLSDARSAARECSRCGELRRAAAGRGAVPPGGGAGERARGAGQSQQGRAGCRALRGLVAKDEISRETYDQAVSAEQAASATRRIAASRGDGGRSRTSPWPSERGAGARPAAARPMRRWRPPAAGPEQVKGTEARAQAAWLVWSRSGPRSIRPS